MREVIRKLLVTAAAVAGLGMLAVPAASAAPKPLPLLICAVTVSNQHPADYSTVTETVHVGAAGIKATVTNAYSTKNTVATAVSGKPAGTVQLRYPAVTSFKISDAKPGYEVKVAAVVTWPGWRSGSCTSWFTPQAKPVVKPVPAVTSAVTVTPAPVWV
jgi:hypothetical protein